MCIPTTSLIMMKGHGVRDVWNLREGDGKMRGCVCVYGEGGVWEEEEPMCHHYRVCSYFPRETFLTNVSCFWGFVKLLKAFFTWFLAFITSSGVFFSTH